MVREVEACSLKDVELVVSEVEVVGVVVRCRRRVSVSSWICATLEVTRKT